MKVVLVGSAYPFRGGLASYNERLAREFHQAGDSFEILTFTTQYPGLLFPGKTQYSTSPPPRDLAIRRGVSSVNPLSWLAAGQALNRLRPDLVLIKYWLPFMAPCFGTVARLARRNGHTKVIGILDNVVPHERRPGDSLLSTYFLGGCHGFVAMSQQVMDDLDRFDTQKPRALTPHPIFDNFGEPLDKAEAQGALGLEPGARYILFFGFIRSYKGLDILLEAMTDRRVEALGVKLIIAGEFYEDDGPYLEYIREHDLDGKLIKHFKFIADEEVGRYFSACDLVVQPYKSATQSGVTQIAFQFDKPVVVTDVGGLAGMVPHGRAGYVVDVEPERIADAIVDFYQHNRSEAYEANVREEKKKYGWDVLRGKLISLYEAVKS